MNFWLKYVILALCAVLVKTVDRQASLVVLPPIVIGYEELYEDTPEEIDPATARRQEDKQIGNNSADQNYQLETYYEEYKDENQDYKEANDYTQNEEINLINYDLVSDEDVNAEKHHSVNNFVNTYKRANHNKNSEVAAYERKSHNMTDDKINKLNKHAKYNILHFANIQIHKSNNGHKEHTNTEDTKIPKGIERKVINTFIDPKLGPRYGINLKNKVFSIDNKNSFEEELERLALASGIPRQIVLEKIVKLREELKKQKEIPRNSVAVKTNSGVKPVFVKRGKFKKNGHFVDIQMGHVILPRKNKLVKPHRN